MPAPVRHSDDDLFRGSWRWLGPKGYTLPMSIPYRGILPGSAAFVICLIVMSAFGVGTWRFLIAGTVGVGVMKAADLFGSTERPVSSLAAILTHETAAPRPLPRQDVSVRIRPSQIPVHSIPARAGERSRR